MSAAAGRLADAAGLLAGLARDDGGTRRDGVLSLPHRAPGRAGFTPRFAGPDDDVDDVARRCLLLADAGADVYVGVQLLRAVPPPRRGADGRLRQGRGGAADTCGLVALSADLDFAGPGHAETRCSGLPLPPTASAALSVLDGLPEPTLTVATGGGLHVWWLLHAHARLDVAGAAAVSRGWGAMVCARGAQRGWHVDPTGDLARVLRLPGTLNHKYGTVVEVVGVGPRHELAELAALVPVAPEPVAPVPVTTPRASGGGTSAAEVTDRWSAETDWAALLEPYGWRLHRDGGYGERHWTRPGKTGGTSAVSHDSPPVLHVFTTGSALPTGTHTKLRAYACLAHGGDVQAAWHAIAPPPAPPADVPDVERLARFVAAGGPPGRLPGRLRWACRQIAGTPGWETGKRMLVRAAVGAGMTLADAVETGRRALREDGPR